MLRSVHGTDAFGFECRVHGRSAARLLAIPVAFLAYTRLVTHSDCVLVQHFWHCPSMTWDLRVLCRYRKHEWWCHHQLTTSASAGVSTHLSSACWLIFNNCCGCFHCRGRLYACEVLCCTGAALAAHIEQAIMPQPDVGLVDQQAPIACPLSCATVGPSSPT